MHSPMIHHTLFIVVLTGLFRLRPLIAVKLAMTLTARAFLAGLVPVCLNPAGVASAAVDPAGVAFAEEKAGANVITRRAVAGDVYLNGRL